MDFCYNRRDEIIEYVKEKYGSDHVSQIATFGTLAAKAAITQNVVPMKHTAAFMYPTDSRTKLLTSDIMITTTPMLLFEPPLVSFCNASIPVVPRMAFIASM